MSTHILSIVLARLGESQSVEWEILYYSSVPPALCVIALPSCSSPGCVIDRPQQLRPPTALSVLIRVLIGRLAVGEWHQGLGHRGDTDFLNIPFMPFPFHFLSVFCFIFAEFPSFFLSNPPPPSFQLLCCQRSSDMKSWIDIFRILLCVFNWTLLTHRSTVTDRLKKSSDRISDVPTLNNPNHNALPFSNMSGNSVCMWTVTVGFAVLCLS